MWEEERGIERGGNQRRRNRRGKGNSQKTDEEWRELEGTRGSRIKKGTNRKALQGIRRRGKSTGGHQAKRGRQSTGTIQGLKQSRDGKA